MIRITSADAQNRLGQRLEMAQREPAAITRHGRTTGFVIAPKDMEILLDARAGAASGGGMGALGLLRRQCAGVASRPAGASSPGNEVLIQRRT